jgi:hypothetical protein
MNDPRDPVAEIEACPRMPNGSEERFAGYGVMGLPFRSGHILALRRFPALSIGPGYRSVWHRDPNARWTFFQDVAPVQASSRYFGAAVAEIVAATIEVDRVGPRQFSVTVTDGTRRLDWSVTLTTSPITRAMSGIGALLPEALWRQRWFLANPQSSGSSPTARPSSSESTWEQSAARQLPDTWPTFEFPGGAGSRSGGRPSDQAPPPKPTERNHPMSPYLYRRLMQEKLIQLRQPARRAR